MNPLIEATSASDLRAPLADESGIDNWRYSLFLKASPEDVVYHYDKKRRAIVGRSVIASDPERLDIRWGARGSSARTKGITPHLRPGYRIALSQFTPPQNPLSLSDIRAAGPSVALLIKQMSQNYSPLYFPFEVGKRRPIRPLQGYAFKLPAGFILRFPTLLAEEREINRNPPWTRDELILALDLYMRSRHTSLSQDSPEIERLSLVLRSLAGTLHAQTSTFRKRNGIHMKLMTFHSIDPIHAGRGRKGLTRGNKLERDVWDYFYRRPEQLRGVAAQLTQVAAEPSLPLLLLQNDAEGEDSAPEGRVLVALHRYRERDRTLSAKRKSYALQKYVRLACEACGFDFTAAYGERGRGYIECHHIRPLHTLSTEAKHKLEDLALLCANCHRMIHARSPWLTVDQLRVLIAHHSPRGLTE